MSIENQKRQVRQNAARRIPEQSLPLRVSQKRRWQNGTEPGNRCCGTAYFQLAATGIGAAAVTRELFKRGIRPRRIQSNSSGSSTTMSPAPVARRSSSTVLRILEDERYIGSYVIGRRAVIEVGGTRSRRKDRDKWFIIPDHHPAIVDKELFEKVQAVQRRFSLPTRKTREYPLKGKVYCGCCDHALSRIAQRSRFICAVIRLPT